MRKLSFLTMALGALVPGAAIAPPLPAPTYGQRRAYRFCGQLIQTKRGRNQDKGDLKPSAKVRTIRPGQIPRSIPTGERPILIATVVAKPSRYTPHQGAKECARRARRLEAAQEAA